MKYLGSFTINDSTLILNIDNKYYPEKWNVSIKDNKIYCTSSVDQEDNDGTFCGTKYYHCHMRQDDEYVVIEDESHFEEE
jgi:hypothetical protein